MKRLAAANTQLHTAGRWLWHNFATVWLCVASMLLVYAYLQISNEQARTQRLAQADHARQVQLAHLRAARVKELRTTSYRICTSQNQLRDAVRSAIQAPDPRVTSYYRQHPGELAAARRAAARLRARFKRVHCANITNVTKGGTG